MKNGTNSKSNRTVWAEARARLASATNSLGFPEAFADLMAKQIGTPLGMDRMTSYLINVRPHSVEMIVDEMLAICADSESWRRKKEGREAQTAYSAWINSSTRAKLLDEDETARDSEEEDERFTV